MATTFTSDSLRQLFQSAFHLTEWREYLQYFFGATALREQAEVIEGSETEKGFYLGKIDTSDNYSIGLFHYQVSKGSVVNKRVGLRHLVKSFINPTWGEFDAALVVFDDGKHWRLSFICDIKGENTMPKRYTFVFGESENYYNTAVNRFVTLKQKGISFETLKDAFSVEALSKDFYKDLFEWYQWAVDPFTKITFPNNTSTEDDDRDDIETKIIRMITRIMFVWFIKQKQLVPDCIFELKHLKKILKDFDPLSTTVGNYYNAILQNLFFGTLNRAIIEEDGSTRKFSTSSKRDVKTLYRYAEMFTISKQEVIDTFAEIPFLNGGLFECLDKTRYIDGVEQCYNFDGFSRNDARFADGRFKHRAVVPNILFFEPERGLLSILSRYNFTIEENSPEEQQVALDPELLGKVFENLLGAYNPETQETARNQSGSFYTPREIVNFMVDESLIAYLGKTELVRSLFGHDFQFDPSKTEQYKEIADKLKAIKILDPACGSGAFPMGILNRMVEIFERIQPDANVYELKLSIIENCLYGSDIQSIAAQITKLRFFISLICNCEKDASAINFGIPTLPNLETKFVSANTLIAKKKKDAQLELFENPDIETTKSELAEIRHKHFAAKSASTKHRLRKQDQDLREKLANLLSENNFFDGEHAKQLAEWNPYDQNAVSSFFDPEWMFGVSNGFDIVIGNPPYISTKDIGITDKNAYKVEFGFSDDTYNLFTFKGLSLLKEGGSLSYIIPKTFWTTQTKRNMRDLLLKYQIDYIFDTANPFESVMVDTCIVQVLKRSVPDGHKVNFLDGTKNLKEPFVFEPIKQSMFLNSVNSIIFKPTDLNLRIYELYNQKVKELFEQWWDKIDSSKKIAKNQQELEAYRASLKPGDVTLLGCLTEGGQGLATANNGKYIAVRSSTKSAKNIRNTRPKKLAEAIKKKKVVVPEMADFADEKDFLDSLSEKEIATLFDALKEKYGRDIFGQGYLYKIIEDSELANVDELSKEEKENGIDPSKNYYVPYDKGDKDGNRWYLETPFAIAWSKENVQFLKTNSGKKGQGMPVVRNPQFYFREGLCWSDINTTFLKCRKKAKSIHDVKSMSIFGVSESVKEDYIITLVNSTFISYYVDNFVNNTQTFQINDARQLPVIIPRKEENEQAVKFVTKAIRIKKDAVLDNESLDTIQKEVDLYVEKLYHL